MTTQTTKTKDRFASPEYVSTTVRPPKIAALRGELSDEMCGYFISDKYLSQAQFKNIDPSKFINYQYNSGGVETGLLIKQPKMLVVPTTPLLCQDMRISKEYKQVVYEEYNYARHGKEHDKSSNEQRWQKVQYYNILLLDGKNEPLHDVPLEYVSKGANSASFNDAWKKVLDLTTKFHALANDIPNKPKNHIFNALCVFRFECVRELVGTGQKSFACKVGKIAEPTAENWEKFFLGRNDVLADKILSILDPQPPTMPRQTMQPVINGELVLAESTGYDDGYVSWQ